MPYSAGIFNLTYDWVTEQASPPIEISKLKIQETDIATGLSNCILRDGTGVPTAATPWNSQKITGLGNATLTADAINAGQVQTGALIKLGSVSGVDTITASLTPSIAAYTTGQFVVFTPAGTNLTTTSTLNINGVGAKTIKKGNAIALDAGDLIAAVQAICIYDGTNFVLQNPQIAPGMTQNDQTAGNYGFVMTDANNSVLGNGGFNYTLPSNAAIPMKKGTTIVIANNSGTTALTIKITADALELAGAGTTGDRTLAAYGIATLYKYATTGWRISGSGVS